MKDNIEQLELLKLKLEIKQLKQKWYTDPKFILPFILSISLAFISISEWRQKQKAEEKVMVQKDMIKNAIENEEKNQRKIDSIIEAVDEIQASDKNPKTRSNSYKALNNVLEQARLDTEKYRRAKFWEESGFSYLLKRNYNEAVSAFSKAKSLYPTYHNVSQIYNLLINKKDLINTESSNWEKTYQEILNKYHYGIPNNIKLKMQQSLQNK